METLNLFTKLSIIRKEITVKKTGFNKFGNYKYYEIDEIYRQAKELFHTYNVFTTFSLVFEGDIKQYRAVLMVINGDNPGETFTMSIDSPLNELKGSASQQVGSNNTYQSKYLYMDLLMLDDGKNDPDKHDAPKKKPEQSRSEVARKSYQQVTRVPIPTEEIDPFEDI